MEFTAKNLRHEAWRMMSGQWGKLVLIFLLYSLIVGAAGITVVGAFIVSGPILIGVYMVCLNVVKGGTANIGDMFGGFDKLFGKSIILWITNNLFIFFWSLLLIIPGIIKSYSYSMSYYILAEHPDISAGEARKLSMEMMSGNKWKLFCLHLSFIGWLLLSVLTFGVLMLWVSPYMQCAESIFYNVVKGKVFPEDELKFADEETYYGSEETY